ncbi:MAG: response regulator transcription factor [Ruminococcus sp.]|nr:response regulator transcription factor [Ruminococcus sp.]
MIKVIIADDIPILCQGLKAILSQDKDIEVVGMAGNGLEAYQLTEKLLPDVVLMDMRMPEYDGEFGTRKIKESFPNIKVIILTTFDDEENISKAMSGGADGYLLKEMDNDTVIRSLKMVMDGISVFGSSATGTIQKRFSQSSAVTSATKQNIPLTDRELDIIRLIAEGMDNKEISSTLYLAEGTVRNNISKMLEKLSLKDRTQLAVYAIKNNIV